MRSKHLSVVIWYISKYATTTGTGKVGARGFLLLREFVRSGHRAVLITSDSNHLAESPALSTARMRQTVDGVEVLWLKTRKYNGAQSLGRVASWLDFERRLLRVPKGDLPPPDIVIVSSLSLLTIFNGFILRRRFNCKLVFEVRDIWPLVLTAVGNFSPAHPAVRFLGWVERLAYRRADLIVGTMPNLAEHVREVSGSTKPVVCIPQGLSDEVLERPAPLPDGYEEAFIPSGKFVVCHAGSIGADNALETLLLCARAMQERRDIHFLLVGEGYLKETLSKEYAGLENVTFAPAVPKAAVQSVLQQADLLYFAVHRSPLMRFGQSLNKVIDYMFSGKPILASFTGYPSMINEAECGSYVPAEDVSALREEIERYVSMSPEHRARLGAQGREWLLRNRPYQRLAENYLNALQVECINDRV